MFHSSGTILRLGQLLMLLFWILFRIGVIKEALIFQVFLNHSNSCLSGFIMLPVDRIECVSYVYGVSSTTPFECWFLLYSASKVFFTSPIASLVDSLYQKPNCRADRSPSAWTAVWSLGLMSFSCIFPTESSMHSGRFPAAVFISPLPLLYCIVHDEQGDICSTSLRITEGIPSSPGYIWSESCCQLRFR